MWCRLLPLFLLLPAAAAVAEIQTREVTYQVGERDYSGYFAWDAAVEGPRPGVLVVHEWWGHNDYARERARMLAGLGYTALALDMYGQGRVAEHPDEAGKMSQALMNDLAAVERRFEQAHDLLDAHPQADPGRTAAIGYCMGGSVALQMARFGKALDAVVSFHGGLGTERPAKPGAVEAPILVLTGGADPFIPDAQIEAFREEMETVGADYAIEVYPGAKHSFTNPQADEFGARFELPLAYDPEADRASWQRMQEFLASHLQ